MGVPLTERSFETRCSAAIGVVEDSPLLHHSLGLSKGPRTLCRGVFQVRFLICEILPHLNFVALGRNLVFVDVRKFACVWNRGGVLNTKRDIQASAQANP